jgi:diguanylate cyclase (GGDEF)-like protein
MTVVTFAIFKYAFLVSQSDKQKLEETVQERTQELEKTLKVLQEMSRIDGLTGLLNRTYFIDQLEARVSQAQRTKSIISLVMLDLDYFKKVNDQYGHLGGDACLVAASDLMRKMFARESDLIGRFGGEEFVLAFFGIDEEGTAKRVEEYRTSLESLL